MTIDRRTFLAGSAKTAVLAGVATGVPAHLLRSSPAGASELDATVPLADPEEQPMFRAIVPNALDPAFIYQPNRHQELRITARQTTQRVGLVGGRGRRGRRLLTTTVWGYGLDDRVGATWPGRTISRHVDDEPLSIRWQNDLVDRFGQPLPHVVPVDPNLHWAYALHGHGSANGVDYREYSIAEDGVPLAPHVHGGHNDSSADGNPEFFFSPGFKVLGPRFVDPWLEYGGPDWNPVAGTLWYHDHALGLTRLNVYAGLAGFFILRDDNDTGQHGNPAGLPAEQYELAYAVQDRMFTDEGQLFWPAYPGDPAYDDFIEIPLPGDAFPQGGPTQLAEFFGDFIVVNGKIWPKADVEPRQYRVRLLNGCDSRFMRLRLRVIHGAAGDGDAIDLEAADPAPLPFYVVGSDQGLRDTAAQVDTVDFLPGERIDLVVDFGQVAGSRVIVENLLGDSPFGGELPESDDLFDDRRTDRVMAFDVGAPLSGVPDTWITDGSVLVPASQAGNWKVTVPAARVRKLALFEGNDEFGRLQPLLGTAEEVTDVSGATVTGTLPWHMPITENPEVGDTEIWEIFNATGDAHPVHVHLVHFEVLDRQEFTADLDWQPVLQHDGTFGNGFKFVEDSIRLGPVVAYEYDEVEQSRRDMVLALPGQMTRIRMTFDKPGRYVWHCHILSHEDHEMMRPFHVGPVPAHDATPIPWPDDVPTEPVVPIVGH